MNFLNLKCIQLQQNSIDKEGAQYLSLSKYTDMEWLNLMKTDIWDEGVIELLKGTNFVKNLIKLNLSSNSISNIGLEAISKCVGLQNLQNLSLGYNAIGDDGIYQLADSVFV